MSELRRYPDYKDSGVPWLGDIPSHWEAKQLKHSITYNDETLSDKTDPQYEFQYVDISSVSLINGITNREKLNFDNSPSRARRIVRKGDVIVSTVRTYLKAITQVEEDFSDLIVSTGFAVLRPKEDLLPKYLGYWIQSDYIVNSIMARSVGVSYPAINATELVRLPVVELPKLEQQAIVNFLDDKLNHIDTLISKQQQLIETLAEQRSAVITHAVTKGLDPNVPMKDSGVEWLGEIPEHWDSFKITHLVETIGSGTTPKSSNSNYYADEGTLWVTTSELRESVIADTKKKLTEDALQDYSTLKVFPINSVAIAMYGATIGRLGILGEEATFNQACCVYSESEKIHYKFLYYWLWYRRPILISLSNGGGQPNLNQDDLRKLVIPIPAIKEQEEIVNYLDNKTQKIDKMSEATTDIITKLQEYRAALITQAVTGKIDVRYLNQQAS
ncbi:restriction endonuclease subunit S [Psychrobacter celer]|uniref:restriction endonuclease subunit S n=1 Tax=Psychrobacter celer TaxID=306572 RepID=UPI003FD1A733